MFNMNSKHISASWYLLVDQLGASNGTSERTSRSICSEHNNATSNLSSTMSEIQEDRIKETKLFVKKYFSRDDSNVLGISRPRDRAQARLADRLSADVFKNLEETIRSCGLSDSENLNPQTRRRHVRPSTQAKRGSAQRSRPSALTTKTSLDDKTHQDMLHWIHMARSSSESMQKESDMYPRIAAFIQYVTDEVAKGYNSKADSGIARPRCIVPFTSFDINADDADDYTRIDMALTDGTSIKEGSKPRYRDILAVVEVKRSQANQDSAFHQLLMHARTIYEIQFSRRFTWGLTVCGTFVRACLFLHDNIHTSVAMDVSTHAGRRDFVSLLVNWSICEEERLGYDPTIRYNKLDRCWEIDVFDKDSRSAKTYICDTIMQDACSVFGRHTHCFTARLKRDQLADDDSTSPRADKVLIKDAWAHVANGSIHDEVAYLYEIRQKLGEDKKLEGTYPYLEAGAVVRICGASNRYAEDTTQHIMQGGNGNIPKVQREHRRLVMSPIGEPLQSVSSVDELIVVAYDAMAAHAAILKRCSILHRDISINNILVRRNSSSSIGGMLIDFDNAIRTGDFMGAHRPDRTGTLPYMSICNLEESSVKRTALDDWESLIYILCWLGTIGMNRDDQSNSVDTSQLPIGNWQHGDAVVIADTKRVHMCTLETLNVAILNYFCEFPGYDHLGELIADLYLQLFQNPRVSLRSKGCGGKKFFGKRLPNIENMHITPDGRLIDERISSEITDPFARRAEIADEIMGDLLEALKVARDQALDRIAQRSG
ncbi:hypothetical protein H4R20_000046 [Coemansia guatemalensis]|uniref:Fungal-type protein kinase domain-containing protein n=1 Tax=Coemansia guatemalensis TaxID=2761395 RepID=A0A9W8I286_9FUNG|nr:hypothetical protein H4R20_000046 [Coemansia guatemalensis]